MDRESFVDVVKKLIGEHWPQADPLLPLEEDDAWYLLNAVLNEISEQFALGHIKKDMGETVRSERYLICLTNERAGELKTRKIRAMVIQKKVLLALPEEIPKLESPQHATRYRTLKRLAEEYRGNPARFLDMEICV